MNQPQYVLGAIYARASLGKRQGDTVDHQIEMIKEFARRDGINVKFDEQYVFSDEESGYKTTLLQRPNMKKLLDSIESGVIKVVFFKGISRFARDSGEVIVTAKKLSNMGVRVISLEENYDSFRDDPTMFQIYAVMAEQESRKTSIRVSLGNKQRARNGIFPNSTIPLGYTRIKNIEDKELKAKLISEGKNPKSLYPNEKEEIIKKIFKMYVDEGLGRKKITSWLNLNGYKTEKGNLFQEKNIKEILLNRVYIGDVVYGKTRYNYIEDEEKNKKIQRTVKLDEDDWAIKENAHFSIVEREIFFKAQIKINEKSSKYNRKKGFNASKHPLTGILKCAKCGGGMVCQKRSNKKSDGTIKEYRYYICSTYHKKGRHVCDQANVNADILEDFVYKYVKKEVTKMKEKLQIGEKVRNDDNMVKDVEIAISNIDVSIQKKVKMSTTLLENMSNYDKETFQEINKNLQNEIKELRTQKHELDSKLKMLGKKDDTVDIQKLFEDYMNAKMDDIGELRTTFHEWIEEITIEDKKIKNLKMRYSV